MNIFNSLTRQLEPFRPLKGRLVRMYTCGPTVYDFAHIGNLRTYIFEDALKRALLAEGYRVQHVMNITDVGHLTSDADEGEDKIERAAARQNKSATKITQFYTRAFLKDLKHLNILSADELPRATAYITEQIALIRRLERRGFTYQTSDGIYFDTSKFTAYGQAFGGQKLEEKEAGARVEVRSEKRSPHDFALWKLSYPTPRTSGVAAGFSPPRADGDPFDSPVARSGQALKVAATNPPKRQQEWKSPWGVGFPGWHIECSAMGRKLLGQPFDIHCGGIDHIPVHHMNEIAQSEAAYEKPLANYWMHGAFLTVEGKRMGKSEGNLVTIDQLVERGFDPLAYRYLVLGAHYRSSLNFTWESVAAAQSALEHLREYCRTLPTPPRPPSHGEVGKNNVSPPHFGRGSERGWGPEAKDVFERFQGAFANDLDTPKALAVLWELTKSSIAPTEQASIIAWADGVLGLNLDKFIGKKIRIPKEVLALAQQREDARKAKDWARADIVRAQIHALGFQVEDTSDGPKVKPIEPTEP